jgi:hypothetical protein
MSLFSNKLNKNIKNYLIFHRSYGILLIKEKTMFPTLMFCLLSALVFCIIQTTLSYFENRFINHCMEYINNNCHGSLNVEFDSWAITMIAVIRFYYIRIVLFLFLIILFVF